MIIVERVIYMILWCNQEVACGVHHIHVSIMLLSCGYETSMILFYDIMMDISMILFYTLQTYVQGVILLYPPVWTFLHVLSIYVSHYVLLCLITISTVALCTSNRQDNSNSPIDAQEPQLLCYSTKFFYYTMWVKNTSTTVQKPCALQCCFNRLWALIANSLCGLTEKPTFIPCQLSF